jgi:hypothetical protein
MAVGQVGKSSAYFSRYQVKLRRRREGKTDYRCAAAQGGELCSAGGVFAHVQIWPGRAGQ